MSSRRDFMHWAWCSVLALAAVVYGFIGLKRQQSLTQPHCDVCWAKLGIRFEMDKVTPTVGKTYCAKHSGIGDGMALLDGWHFHIHEGGYFTLEDVAEEIYDEWVMRAKEGGPA